MAMSCATCGKALLATARFCPRCGGAARGGPPPMPGGRPPSRSGPVPPLPRTPPPRSGPTKNEAELESIAGVYQRGDYAMSIQMLADYVRRYPRDETAWTILGHAHEKCDQDGLADAAYRQALQVNANQHQALTGLGVLCRKARLYDQAIHHYQAALRINPNYAQAYSSMTVIAIKQRQDTVALQYARKGYELEPTDPVICANLAIALHYNGLFAERDQYVGRAGQLGYHGMQSLYQIMRGETTVRDD